MKTVIINAVISIAVVLLAVFSVLSHIEGTYATKDELVPFAEKEGLTQFLTERALEPYARKEQLKGLALDTNIAETREDLNEVINAFSQVKGELADLKALEEEMAVLEKAQGALAGKFERLPGAETYQPPVGAVIASLFSEKQFQSQYGEGWVTADGRAVEGSRYEKLSGKANIPDLRGVFLRGKNYDRAKDSGNPDGDLTVGTFQADMFQQHTHSFNRGKGREGPLPSVGEDVGIDVGKTLGVDRTKGIRVGFENRPRNVTVIFFVRIN